MKSSHLTLEPIRPSHAAALFSLIQSPELYQFIPQNPPADIAALETKYTRWAKGGSDDGSEIWINLAIYHNGIKSYVGTLQATVIPADQKAYIAYEIFPAFQRQGIAKESCSQMLASLLAQYPLKEILVHVDTRNAASIKLLQSMGFILQDTLYQADEFKGSISDEYVYAYPF